MPGGFVKMYWFTRYLSETRPQCLVTIGIMPNGDEALKAVPKAERWKSLAHLALKQIQAIYNEESRLKGLPTEERLQFRELNVKPLVEAYFKWVQQNVDKVLSGSKTHKGLTYSLNHGKYLVRVLEDGEVPMDNNAAEQTIPSFCIGRRNWMMIISLVTSYRLL